MTSKVKGRKAQEPTPGANTHRDKYGISDMGAANYQVPDSHSGPLENSRKFLGKKRRK